jgi:hypothetical protein
MDAGYSGCLRNLEINDKMYNFNAAANGGDVAEGRDIGKLAPLLHRFRNVYIFSHCSETVYLTEINSILFPKLNRVNRK